MSKKTRSRQLARVAARRQAEKRRKQRQRATAIAVALAVAALGAGLAFAAFRGGGERAAGRTPTPTSAPSAIPSSVTPSPGPKAVACGAKAPADATRPKPQFVAPPSMKVDANKTYIATLDTSCGTIVIKLLPARAPTTVNNFVFLVEKGYFDGTRFHRLDTGIDVIQGGDPTGTGSGGPGYTIPDELRPGMKYVTGVVAMANAGRNTGGSQFFIVTGPGGSKLDANPNYTIFGRVIKGLDVSQRIQNLPIQDPQAAAQGDLSGQQPKQSVYIDRITITVKK